MESTSQSKMTEEEKERARIMALRAKKPGRFLIPAEENSIGDLVLQGSKRVYRRLPNGQLVKVTL